ncbi:MAG: sugar phosphate nucleotidyltransferase [Candidatus Cloacimonadales bacterium]|jgi:UDP-N-acetylglucosamine diphosphorylase/glucosamine-1-phosphate N-acetyltransferase|nr:NTP transferase domain-containing protein [Candidatus Cloacimonadota bacterium]MDX9977585.1 sugar phosphate nucleotidyltransferase [Candidatus Cloacimonadales bacterium]
MKTLASIILAAGKGTRMKSEKSKVSFSLAGKSLVQRVVETSLKSNCNKIVVIVGYKKEEVISCIPPHESLEFCEQKEQLGTGHAVKVAEESFKNCDGEVFILCGDVPLLKAETLEKTLDSHRKNKAYCTVLTMILDDPGRYGRMVRDNNNNICKIVEYKDASDEQRLIKEINSGIYCFDIKALFAALKKVDNKNEQNEYYLTDVLEILYKENKRIDAIVLEDVSEAAGINSQEQLAELEDELYKRVNKYWLNNGVVIEKPNTVIISEDAIIENDVTIQAGSVIRGKSEIKKNSVVGINTCIDNSIIGNDCVLKGHNVLINSKLEPNAIMDWQEMLIND